MPNALLSTRSEPRLLAAIDLGSNSFRLLIGRVLETPDGAQIYPLDEIKESVRLASGLTAERRLDAASQARALRALQKFGERLRGFAPEQVRAVATNTLRVAKNAEDFLPTAEAALGFPIEVVSGREEARLIYSGVAHSLPNEPINRLVIDIGGGSTEFIIGRQYEPQCMESLFMGCVAHTLKYFAEGVITNKLLKAAEAAARQQVQRIAADYKAHGWQAVYGSSGTAKALVELLESNQWSEQGITRKGLQRLREKLLEAGHIEEIKTASWMTLKLDRIPVLLGGYAIMVAIFDELDIEVMHLANGALRSGVLYDLLGRTQEQDMRELTIEQLMRRYGVDRPHAQRVAKLASQLFSGVSLGSLEEHTDAARLLRWCASLHEVGWWIAHESYHKHTAYIIANADMPGFSRRVQQRMANILLCHAGKLVKLPRILGATESARQDRLLVLCLRLALLLERRRMELKFPAMALYERDGVYVLDLEAEWLKQNPLTASSIAQELLEWQKIGFPLEAGFALEDTELD